MKPIDIDVLNDIDKENIRNKKSFKTYIDVNLPNKPDANALPNENNSSIEDDWHFVEEYVDEFNSDIDYSSRIVPAHWKLSPVGQAKLDNILNEMYLPGYWTIHEGSGFFLFIATKREIDKRLVRFGKQDNQIINPEGEVFEIQLKARLILKRK